MQKRTKTIIFNVCLSPLMFIKLLLVICGFILSYVIGAIPNFKSIPMSDEDEKILNDKRSKEKQDLIDAIKKSSQEAKLNLPEGYGNILIPTQFKEIPVEFKEYN